MRRASLLVKLLIVLGIVAALAFAGTAALRWFAPSVRVTRVVEGPVVRAIYATGTISPEREYPIRAAAPGTIEQLFVDKGSAVTAGQRLAQLAEPQLAFDVAKARAELAERQARADERASPVLAEFDARIAAADEQLGIAQREETRQRDLRAAGGGSVTDVDRAADRTQTAVALAAALKEQRASKLLELRREVRVSESALAMAEANLARQTLVSPIDGVVLDRPVSQGTRVAINDVVMRIADVRPEKLVMRAAVDEEDVTRVTVGQKVIMTLYAFEGATFIGKVKTIYAEADAARRTFEVDVEVDRPSDRFQPGMTGELAFVLEERERATVVPGHAVQEGAIYALRDGRIVKLDARIGVQAVDRAEILDGVSPDDRVIISSVTPAMVGSRARATEVDPREAAGLPAADKPVAADTFKGMK